MSSDKRIMGIDELAVYLEMSRSTLYKLSQEGKMPCQKVGRHWKYNRERIDEWIAKGGMDEGKSSDYGAGKPSNYGTQLDAPPQGPQENNDLKRYFSLKQVYLLESHSIRSVSDVLLSLATNKGKSELAETLGITPKKLDETAVRITEEIQSRRK